MFPQIQNGFLDQEPAIREKTVIAVIHLAPKLNFANLDECVVSTMFEKLLQNTQLLEMLAVDLSLKAPIISFR